MKKTFLTLILTLTLTLTLSIASTEAMEKTFAWDANTEADLAYYQLWQGASLEGPYEKLGNKILAGTETIVLEIPDGTWFWYLTATNTSGLTSDPSNIVTATVNSVPPEKPKNFLVRLLELAKRLFSFLT